MSVKNAIMLTGDNRLVANKVPEVIKLDKYTNMLISYFFMILIKGLFTYRERCENISK